MSWRVFLWIAAGLWAVLSLTAIMLEMDAATRNHAQVMGAIFVVGAILADKLDKAR